MELSRLDRKSPSKSFHQVAVLHAVSIHHGILGLLGVRFMETLYAELSTARKTGVWVATERHEVLGFICGCASLRGSFLSIAWRPRVVAALLVALLRSPAALRRIFSVLLYPFRSRADTEKMKSRPELLAIAVAPATQGQGVGRALVLALEQELLLWDAGTTYQVTTNVEEAASNAFYLAMGFEATGTIPHHVLTLQMYEKRLKKS